MPFLQSCYAPAGSKDKNIYIACMVFTRKFSGMMIECMVVLGSVYYIEAGGNRNPDGLVSDCCTLIV